MKTKITLLLLAFYLFSGNLYSQTGNPDKTFTNGSYIIDMGINTSLDKGLKPYGLVYALIQAKVPVYWSINSSKVKDGTDFSVGGKSYKGGPFIIASEDVTPAILTIINYWKNNKNVDLVKTNSSFDAPIFNKLTSWPNAIIDTENDDLITPYYSNAGIPSASYKTQGNPTQLTSCGDIYVLPHADPQDWSTTYVNALRNYMNNGGYLWAGCHAVSALDMESISL